MTRRTKIVATIGPASQDEAMLCKLIRAGMDVARLNFSHGTHAQHAQTIQNIRRASQQLGRPIAILQDLQGPKLRIGELRNGKVELTQGQSILLTTAPIVGDQERIPVDFPEFVDYARPGSRILLADGQLDLVVKERRGDEVLCEVVLGGTLLPHKGVNLPGARLDIPSFTQKDAADLMFGLEQGVDAVAISFVRTAEDVARVRRAVAQQYPDRARMPLIAKLERPEALENLQSIIQTSDGVMVARGDLGVEMPPESVPIAQKQIIASANQHSKLVITATQMLDSMIHSPRPTRAEASDVANAIFDGTDALMLSGETAIGDYPLKSIEMMDAIARQAEARLAKWGRWQGTPEEDETHNEAVYICRAAAELAEDRHVAAVAVFTQSGSTARYMSKTRPQVPILGFTSEPHTYRSLTLFWGVIPHLIPRADTMEDLLAQVETAMLSKMGIQRGQQVVLICGFPVAQMRRSNLILLHTVGQHP